MSTFKFLTDIHISVAAIEALRKKGVDIVRSLDVGFTQEEKDHTLLEYATAEGRVVITCDRGFERRSYQ